MGVGARLREERQRLGLSQPSFAALAGASKGALANWESEATSPNAAALIAFEKAGADAVYVLTGNRSVSDATDTITMARQRLDSIERDLIDPTKWRLAGEDDDSLEDRILYLRRAELREIIKCGAAALTSELIERAQLLLNIATDKAELTEFRAKDFLLKRKRREQTKQQLAQWLNRGEWAVRDDALNQLTMLAVEYSVPLKELVELAVLCRLPADVEAAQ